MPTDTHSIALVVGDNPTELDILSTVWTSAGHDRSIAIHSCTSCDDAIFLLHEWDAPGIVISGVLVDLMLFDVNGCAAVNILSDLPLLSGVPIIAWTDFSIEEKRSARITKSSTRLWRKPGNLLEYADFIRRFYNVLDGRSTASNSEHSNEKACL